MIKDLLNSLSYSFFAEAALLMFAAIFAVIVIRTLLTNKQSIHDQANVVLNDGEKKS
jgi:hypothetical protein